MPVYNEEINIAGVINGLPNFIDEIVVVDDKSTDNTGAILDDLQRKNKKVTVIKKSKNEGAGSAKKQGYLYARNTAHDIFVTIDGDGQMDINEINNLIEPIINNEADFAKANRLIHGDVHKKMPRYRFWGNAILTLLTKIASGYWHVTDAQTGFTACNRKVIEALPLEKLYDSYGYPNQILVMLNVFNFRVKDIPSKPIYNVGEKSHLKVRRVVFKISWLLWRYFWWRLKEKYIIRDFHPLVFFYASGFGAMLITGLLSIRLVMQWVAAGRIPPINALAVMFFGLIGIQLLLFAMWFDMEANKNLK